MNGGRRPGRTAMAVTMRNLCRAIVLAGVLLLVSGPARADLFLVTVPCVALVSEPGGALAGGMAVCNSIAAIEGVADGWVQLRLDGGQLGWVRLSAGRRIGEPPAAAPARTVPPPADLANGAPEKPAATTGAPAESAVKPVSPVPAPEVAAPVPVITANETKPEVPRALTVVAPDSFPPPARSVAYFLRTDATVQTAENSITLPAGARLTLVPGDTRTRRALARGGLNALWRDRDGSWQELRPGAEWTAAEPGQYAVAITGEQLRIPAVIMVTVMDNVTAARAPAPAILSPSAAAAPAAAVQPPATEESPAVTSLPARHVADGLAGDFDGSAVYRGLRFAPGMPLAPLAAAWGRPDEQYEKNNSSYYRFGPVTLMTEHADPGRVSGVIFGAGWSVLGVQPGMTLAEVVSRWGAPAMPPLQVALGVWRCGYLRDGFVLGCSLAGPDGPVTDISVTARQASAR